MKKILFLSCLAVATYSSLAQDALPLKGDEIFGSLKARHIGPALMSGRIVDLEGHPTNNKVIYAGAAGGGVWKSADGGVTFSPIFDKHCQSIGNIAIDPKKPDDVIWVGTGETWTRNSVTVGDGIYKSADGGQNWTKMGLEKSERISSIEINPNNTDEIYVGVLGALWGDSDERGVYKTTDGGKSWNMIFSVNSTTGCSDLVMDPKDPNTLYACFWEFRRTAWSFNSGGNASALYKSTDGGKTWNKIHNGFPSGKLGRIAFAVAPSNTNILYAVLESEKDTERGLYRSENAGQSWTRANGDFEIVVRPFYFSRITVDPKNPEILLKASLNGSISKDGGKTFRPVGGGIHADVHDFWFDLHDSNRIYLCDDGGVYRSYDGGSVWDMVKGIPVSQFYQVATDNQTPFKVYGGLQDNGSWIGPSAKPGGIENRDWVSVGAGDGFRTMPHPTDPNIVYSEMQGAENIWRVNLEKNNAKVIKPFADVSDPKLRFNWNTPIATSKHRPDRLYVASQFLHISEDRGETWTKMSPDLTTNDPTKQDQESSGGLSMDNSGAENHTTIFAVNESPLDENIVWVGTDDGNVQVTTNHGKDWSNVTANIPGLPKNTWCYFIEPSSHDKNTAYAVFSGYTKSDFAPYVYKTTDLGKTWKSIVSADLKTYTRAIKEDYVNPNLLYLGTETGLWVSIDGGQNWSQFKNNMPPVAVHWIDLHKRDHALVLATHGRGVIIVDDVSPLRQLTKDFIGQEFVFFKTKDYKLVESGGFAGYARMGEFVGENPTKLPQIVYYQKSRHTFGKMSIEIFDQNGKKIADLPAGKSKGINYVNWNAEIKPPKVAKAKTLAFGGFSGMPVPAGTYKVKVTKGAKEYTNDLVLVADPKSIHTDADRKQQFETASQLYTMTEKLAYGVEQIDAYTAALEPVSAKIVSAKQKKSLPVAALLKDMSSLKDGLVVLKGDNYVGAAEPQLREKIASLYSEVAGYSGKPTGAQIASMAVLGGKLTDALSKIEGFAKTYEKLAPLLTKAGMPATLNLRTWDDFLKADK
jgi:photosystem II stability/assembly factor-like uncharacterized protein